MGREVVVAVTRGRLHLGPREQIFRGECDGWRRKRVLVKIIGEWGVSALWSVIGNHAWVRCGAGRRPASTGPRRRTTGRRPRETGL